MAEIIPVLLITGPPGAGKTSVALEISELLDHARVAHALVDLDSLRWCYPRPAHDLFRVQLALKNLAVVWSNFQAAGATRLVLADVLEAREELEGFHIAFPNGKFFVVRLQASVATLQEGFGVLVRCQRRFSMVFSMCSRRLASAFSCWAIVLRLIGLRRRRRALSRVSLNFRRVRACNIGY